MKMLQKDFCCACYIHMALSENDSYYHKFLLYRWIIFSQVTLSLRQASLQALEMKFQRVAYVYSTTSTMPPKAYYRVKL